MDDDENHVALIRTLQMDLSAMRAVLGEVLAVIDDIKPGAREIIADGLAERAAVLEGIEGETLTGEDTESERLHDLSIAIRLGR
ncbi:hypothetical protein LGQ03_07300 [Loktanella sp. TSTF-M6]|uniref:Uncharacterized protein n=1 Tax=Loktanella gaetbuli TaxID=2881335 RepID=A0ABS8BTR2_9RHOB|nr:hypothetical protein [Loktanella gaetbuli]MCB5199042.1 hypothetical protein [Loktanella gaetbuli]